MPEFSHLKMELPWITFQVFDFVKSILQKKFVVYEFGSGCSSLFFAKHVKMVYSVEHNQDWYYLLKTDLLKRESMYSNLHLKLVVPIPKSKSTAVVSISDKFYFESDFGEYANSILNFPDDFFDLIVIDGRARPYCLQNSIPKLKNGGYLLFDNSDRIHYQEELIKIKNWLILESYGPLIGDLGFGQTSIYRKPLV